MCWQCPCGPGVQVLMSTDVSNCCPHEEGLRVGCWEEWRGIDLGGGGGGRSREACELEREE